MGKSLSLDIRQRVVALVDEGFSCHGAARRLRISAASAVRIMQRRRRSGSVEAALQGRPKRSKLDAVSDWLRAQVDAEPGFDSLTAKHELAQELAGELARGGQVEVLHIGDLDPSGVHLFSSLAEDVAAMVREIAGAEPRFTRLAVTPAQAEHLALPTAPPKATDWRQFIGDTVQCEAIAPDILADILREAIEARRDAEIAEYVLLQEAEFRTALLAMLEDSE